MTNTNSSSSATPIGKAQTLPIQGLVNRVIRVLLRAPLLSRLIGGKRRPADIRILTDETDVVDHLAMMTTDNHQFAKFNRIRLDENGNPVPEDLHLAWVAGARVAVLTPR